MNDKDNNSQFFRPEEVDKQIDSLSQMDASEDEDAEFIHALHNLYTPALQQEQQMLDTIWGRIDTNLRSKRQRRSVRAVPGPLRRTGASPVPTNADWYEQEIPQTRQKQQKNRMPVTMVEENSPTTTPSLQQQRRRKRSFWLRLDALVASILLVSIVGAAIFFFVQAHRQGIPITRVNVTATPSTTPTVFPSKDIGTIVYTSTGVIALNWSPDSQRLVTGTTRGESWDATTGENVVTYGAEGTSGVGSVAWSPDDKQIAVTNIRQLPVKIYDAATGTLEYEYDPGSLAQTNTSQLAPLSFSSPQMPASTGGPGSFLTAWSPDGTRMVTSFGYASAQAYPIQIWDTSTKKMLLNYTGHADFLNALSWSHDGKYILSSSLDGNTQVWDSQTGKPILNLEAQQGVETTAAWSPDTDTIAYVAGDTIELIDATTGKVLLTHHQAANNTLPIPLSNVVWSPDGHSIASGINSIELWDTTTGKTYYTFTDQDYSISELAWSPNGEYLVSDDISRTGPTKLRVWIAR